MNRSLRLIHFFTLVLGLVFLFAGCSNPQSNDPPAAGYVGTWTRSDTNFSYTLVLTSSTFKYTDTLKTGGGTADQASGTLSVSGGNITLTVTSSGSTVTSGSGTWSVSGSTLTIVGTDFAGAYTKS